jgi:hypothetical protein
MSVSQIILLFGTIAATPDAELATMLSANGEDYLRARAVLVERGAAAIPVLKNRKSLSKYTETSWREDVLVDVALAWLETPAEAQKYYALPGLNPATYKQRRRPDPEVGRELRAMRRAVPILFEIELKTSSTYPFLSRDAETQAAERLALRTGVLAAIAGSNHPAAHHVLKAALLNDENPIALRRVAAIGLGQTNAHGAFATLSPIAQDTRAPEALRSGAVAGLGQLRSLASLEVLARLAGQSDEAAEIRKSSVAALGTLSNAWIMRRYRSSSGETIRERASRALVSLLASADGVKLETQIIEAMVMIRHPVLQSELSVIAKDAVDTERSARATRAISRLDLALRRES